MFRHIINSQEIVQEKNFDSLGIQVSYKLMWNGRLKKEKKGVLYGEENSVDTGYEKIYHNNGKLQKHLILNMVIIKDIGLLIIIVEMI